MRISFFTSVVFIWMTFFTSVLIAQDITKEDDFFEEKGSQSVQLFQIRDILLQSEKVNSEFLESSNTIFIEQIGASNVVNANINAVSSNITILQNGNENRIDINESAEEITKIITQTGNNNSVVDFSFDTLGSTSLELIQEGNNLIFEKFGSNELSNNLKFRMTGDFRTIIVRSF
ncbi:hypothetical protein [Aquimarina pacifica]|uniref:hypothetical protein n=1 Tax=Aquimarina pacifica TaxID=1296415 RepID=UPI00046F5A35|nr:hypothetical protein [Aquimarina pacifica]